MAVHTKWRKHVSVRKKDRMKALFLARNFQDIGSWMRHLIQSEIQKHFPRSGETPTGYEHFAERNSSEIE